MRALVIGASGLVGGALLSSAPGEVQAQGTAHAQSLPDLLALDATDEGAVRAALERVRPDWVVFPAANPNVDLCEREPERTRGINVDAPRVAARLCAALGVGMAYFSSDYVFDGQAGPYAEEDPVSPICAYGRQKLEAEEAVRAALPGRHLIVRTTGVYGLERLGKNFVYRAVRTLGGGEVLSVPADQWGNPTWADDLAGAVWRLCASGANGTLHVAGPEVMSRLAFAQLVAEVFGLSPAGIRGVDTPSLGQAAPRPLKAGLRVERAEARLGRPMVAARAGLERIREGVRRGLGG